MKRLESNNCDAAARRARRYISLPVENTATRTAPPHLDPRQPNAAARRYPAAAPLPCPERDRRARCFPLGAPAPAFRPAGRRPCRRHRGGILCMNTVSAPSGIGAPVKMRWPGPAGSPGAELPPGPAHDETPALPLAADQRRHGIAIDGRIVERRQRQRRRKARRESAVGLRRAERFSTSCTALPPRHDADGIVDRIIGPPKAKQSSDNRAIIFSGCDFASPQHVFGE